MGRKTWDSLPIKPLPNRRNIILSSKPIDKSCNCHTCKNYSLSYIHYLLKAKEFTALYLITLHNIFFMNELMEFVRVSIKKDQLEEAEIEWYSKS